MRQFSMLRTVATCAIVGFLAGCGGAQSQIGGSGAMPSAPTVRRDTLVTITVISKTRTLPNVPVKVYLCPTPGWFNCVTIGGTGKLIAHGRTNMHGDVNFGIDIKPKHTYCVQGEWKRLVVVDCPKPPFPYTFTLKML